MALSCLLVNFSISAQNVSLQNAEHLLGEEKFMEAATAFEKAYFFGQSEEDRVDALFKRAYCFKQLNKHHEAYKSLVRVLPYNLNDSLKCAAQYELALNLYLGKFYKDAEKYCAKNRSLPVNTPEYKRTILLHALILNELNDYAYAKQKVLEYQDNITLDKFQIDSLNLFVNSYYSKKKLPKLKSLRKARRLSKVLPGAGLFYAGKPGKALLNITLQLGALGYTGANLFFENYVTAATAGVFMLRSFYTGGINQLNEVVPKVNYKRSRKFNDDFRKNYLTKLQKYYAY